MANSIIAFMGANFVAREVGYNMNEGWGQGDRAAMDHFREAETYGERFEQLLTEVTGAGFRHMDLWTAHLHFDWATPAHLETAGKLLAKHGVTLTSYAGGFGGTVEQFKQCCELCKTLGITMFSGRSPLVRKDREAMTGLLREYGLRFAFENHPEPSGEAILEAIGEGDEDVIGVALDTGWLATQKAPVADALKVVAPRLFHLHLKDVKPPRAEKTGYAFIDMGHETCRLGDGIAEIETCARLLPELGFTGVVSIEHEPEDFDPVRDCEASRKRLEHWMESV